MKRLLLCLFLALLLTGCSNMVKNDILSVSPHVEQPTKASTQPLQETIVVSNRGDLRWRVLYFCRNWIEQGEIWVQDYEGDVTADLNDVLSYATQKDPFGAYGVDYMDAEFTGDSAQGRIALSIVFRRSAAELDAIPTVYSNSMAFDKIYAAIKDCNIALTLCIRNYQEADFAALIRDHCLKNPAEFAVLPEVTANVYPNEGNMRILELQFSYPDSKEELLKKLELVQTTLSSASTYVQTGKSELDRINLLTRFLTERMQYVCVAAEPNMPAYSLLHEKKAHSLSFASVFYAECEAADLSCYLVEGTRNGAAHYWNLVYIDGVFYHIDLMRSIELGAQELLLLYDEDLLAEGYAWDTEITPAAPKPAEPEPSETTVSEAEQ